MDKAKLEHTRLFLLIAGIFFFLSCGSQEEDPASAAFHLLTVEIDGEVNAPSFADVDPNVIETLTFNESVDANTMLNNILLQPVSSGASVPLRFETAGKSVTLQAA